MPFIVRFLLAAAVVFSAAPVFAETAISSTPRALARLTDEDIAAGYKKTVWPGTTAKTLLGFAARVSEHPASTEEGRKAISIVAVRRENGEGVILEIIEDGYADDSVRGERFILIVKKSGDRWRLSSAWSQPICWRGALSAKGRCP